MHVLSAGLPYSPILRSSLYNNDLGGAAKTVSTFSEAFAEAQTATVQRTRLSSLWPLKEFWQEQTSKPMKVVNAFIEPILQEAVEKRKGPVGMKAGEKEIDDSETLLDHLVNYTDGELVSHHFVF